MVFDLGSFIVVYCLQGTFIQTYAYELHRMADAFYFLWFCCLRISRQEHVVRSHPPNTAPHLTVIPLRSLAAGELGRYVPTTELSLNMQLNGRFSAIWARMKGNS